MGKIIVANIVSLDGFYEGLDKNMMVLPMDASFDAFNLEHIKKAKAVLLGATSYKLFSSFWPQVADNPDAGPVHKDFSTIYNQLPKIVITNSMVEADLPDIWKSTSRIVSYENMDALHELKNSVDGDIVIFASHVLWNDLLQQGLVDEIHLVVGNVVLGQGTPAFESSISYDDPKVTLKVIEVRSLPDTNNFAISYQVINK